MKRANAIIAAISSEALELTLPICERGMADKYPSPKCDAPIVREENLTQIRGCDFRWGLSAKQRSMVVAGYLKLRRWFDGVFAVAFGYAGYKILSAKLQS